MLLSVPIPPNQDSACACPPLCCCGFCPHSLRLPRWAVPFKEAPSSGFNCGSLLLSLFQFQAGGVLSIGALTF